MYSSQPVTDLSLCDLVLKLGQREISVTETVQACLARIEKLEPDLGAFLLVNAEQCLEQARRMDEKGPDAARPLWGAPVAVKDALSTKGIKTTAASRILENFEPFYDAFVIGKLKEAGAIIIGKTNMDEFAMGSATENSAFFKTKNPWNLKKVPGGSSGGSAAAVAARECFAALGSDTGGSIRQPAAFCGCVGLKPTYGRVSRYGLFAYGSSLDQIGPLGRTVRDCACMLNVIAGFDARDNTSSPLPVENYLPADMDEAVSRPLAGIKIGYPQAFFDAGLDNDTKAGCQHAAKALQDLGAELITIELPNGNMAIAAYYIIAMAEASSNLARYDGVRYGRRAAGVDELQDLYIKSRSQGFGPEVKRRIMLGSYILSAGYYDAYFKKAAQIRRLIYNQYVEALSLCDAVLMPVSPVTPWNIGEIDQDPLKNYLMDAFTTPVNLVGLPAISLPSAIGAESAMPVGIQLIGKHFEEKKLLFMANALQNVLPKLPCPAI